MIKSNQIINQEYPHSSQQLPVINRFYGYDDVIGKLYTQIVRSCSGDLRLWGGSLILELVLIFAILISESFEVFLALFGLLDSGALHVHLPTAPLLETVIIHVALLFLEFQLVCESDRCLDFFVEEVGPVYSLEKFVFFYGLRTIVAQSFFGFYLKKTVKQILGVI